MSAIGYLNLSFYAAQKRAIKIYVCELISREHAADSGVR